MLASQRGISVQGTLFQVFLIPCVFWKFAEAALVPLRETGICILEDWLLLADSLDLLCANRDMVLEHLAQV